MKGFLSLRVKVLSALRVKVVFRIRLFYPYSNPNQTIPKSAHKLQPPTSPPPRLYRLYALISAVVLLSSRIWSDLQPFYRTETQGYLPPISKGISTPQSFSFRLYALYQTRRIHCQRMPLYGGQVVELIITLPGHIAAAGTIEAVGGTITINKRVSLAKSFNKGCPFYPLSNQVASKVKCFQN